MICKINTLIDRKILLYCGWLFLITAIYAIYLFRVFQYFDRPISPDAARVYLPFATNVLEQGLSFLFKSESIKVAPLSYLWPALFGGKAEVVKCVNIIAGIFMIAFTYGIARRLHSHVAGLVAALLFARSPLLIHWVPTALSEPPFFLFTLIWLWSLGEIIHGKKWAIPIFSVALCLSILSRSVWLYPSIIFLFSTWAWILYRPTSRKIAQNLSIALSLGLIIPALIILKNLILYNLPSIAAGTGAALFYGANIMTNGFEPPLLGLNYENGRGLLSAVGGREHTSVAIQFLKERSMFELWNWYLTKISWNTLFTTLDTSIKISVWRVIEITMATICVWHGIKKRQLFASLLGIAVVLQLLQTAVVLYNPRYSAGNIDLALIPMAAVGIMLSLNIRVGLLGNRVGRDVNINIFNLYGYGISAVVIASILVVALYHRNVPIINLPSNIPVSVLFTKSNILMNVEVQTSEIYENYRKYYVKIDVPKQIMPSGSSNTLWEIDMLISSPIEKRGCNMASLNYISDQHPFEEERKVDFNVYDDGIAHRYFLGTAFKNSHLFPVESGELVIKLDCLSTASIVVNKVSLISPHFIDAYFKKNI